jgi:2-polyprenyl-3-methyl-5-hydroxy-6-metoxy-1,4-benzoquinol methylase
MSAYTRAVRLRGLGRSHELVIQLVPPGATVLDVGCASGYLAEELLARGASAVDGIELDA